MTDRGGRQMMVALVISLARVITVCGWPVLIGLDLMFLIRGERNPLTGLVVSIVVGAMCIALADWVRRGVIAAVARSETDRDQILVGVHDRIDRTESSWREELERSVNWLLRRLDS